MTNAPFVSADAIRAMFSGAMSDMYKSEVPQYAALSELVADINREALAKDPELAMRLKQAGDLDRLGVERHGAIRVGTPEELSTIRRLFAVMGMAPVGYYDLSTAGVPVHSTAFRPVGDEALRRNPFRIFASLLRLDLIDDSELRREAAAILARRNIFTLRCLELLAMFEGRGGLDEAQAREFASEAVATFRWRNEATVPAEVYYNLRKAHPLIADVVCFKGPHINHLTLQALDIDAVQLAMSTRNMNPKAIIEGPPRRKRAILLRQTSFKALPEPIVLKGADGSIEAGAHSARFGEVEQRGVALTAKGRALYDHLLAAANDSVRAASEGSNGAAYAEELRRQFEAFPDDETALRDEELAFFRYSPTADGLRHAGAPSLPREMAGLVQAGYVRIDPIIYEDFLPVSAAGIFQSNLGDAGQRNFAAGANREAFEAALGIAVLDELELYAEAEARSRAASFKALGLDAEPERQGATGQ
ncbi:VOC family protein [Methylocapsa polymorpha]|uniref:2-oxoadipate dioxygenase/decarboxylase n=1 Tax=Methylocapsa polymorpha TaxID=3080828 RepID=A0ABZ0HN13_9HYPH|nr:VOC family protein [Methylocapsa sp. RX1]